MRKHLKRWLKRVSAIVLMIAGLITFPLPIPIGALLFALGLALLISTSQSLTRWIRGHRAGLPKLNAKLSWMETKLPHFLARPLRKTAPDYGRNRRPKINNPETER